MTPPNELILPLFPATGALIPRDSILLAATEHPYARLLLDCAESGHPFAVVHYDEDGVADVGCAAYVEALEERDGALVCEAVGVQRFHVAGTVAFEGDRQRVGSDGREVVFEQDEPLDLPYAFARGEAVTDEGVAAREDLRAEVQEAVLAALDAGAHGAIRDAFDDGLDGELSFFLASIFVPDDTPAGNALRLSLMRKRSENKRLRMLRDELRRLAPDGDVAPEAERPSA